MVFPDEHLTNPLQVYLVSIAGLVPEKMFQCLAIFLDFTYTACYSEHDIVSLSTMEKALAYFHKLHVVLIKTRVFPDRFGLPCQNSLVHYIHSIQQFGSPNGLCSSITKSNHIKAIKKTWRCSNYNEPIDQMLGMLTYLLKLSATAIKFRCCRMLQNNVLMVVWLMLGDKTTEDTQASKELTFLKA